MIEFIIMVILICVVYAFILKPEPPGEDEL